MGEKRFFSISRRIRRREPGTGFQSTSAIFFLAAKRFTIFRECGDREVSPRTLSGRISLYGFVLFCFHASTLPRLGSFNAVHRKSKRGSLELPPLPPFSRIGLDYLNNWSVSTIGLSLRLDCLYDWIVSTIGLSPRLIVSTIDCLHN